MALEELFAQVLQVALTMGVLKLGRWRSMAEIKAYASKHKATSYRRMQEEENRLREDARRVLAEGEQIDKDEDKRYRRLLRGDELPELARGNSGVSASLKPSAS